ncbi:MAG: hypothetical protein IJ724_11885 [Muribaculaceae bacterium]|nr:hypothetical protein [Muribaculaceae bacterium]MBR1476325.1 hypothetical protein [Muribaculaceae bacterium]MBR1727321.1 hypothetical protein [Muribaculaceae bacterium]
MNDKILDSILMVGLVAILVMAVLPLFNINEPFVRWLFAAGALAVLVVRLLQSNRGENLRLRRLYRINVISALMFCASAVMFWSMGQNEWSTNWVAFLMAGAALMMYVSYAIDHEQRRIAQHRDKTSKH